MFTSIKTSENNKDIVTKLTRRLGLGAENVIARLAFAYSLASDRKMELGDMQDTRGKEYSTKVLFGEYADHYVALVCAHYNLPKNDKDIARYVKMHIDDGLEGIYNEIEKKRNITGEEFLINAIEKGLKHFV